MRLVLDIKQNGYKFYLKCVLNFVCVNFTKKLDLKSGIGR